VTAATLAVASLVVVAYAILGLIAIRRPLLRKIAYQLVVRRPWQSALMVAGMMFGSAAILAMATMADTLAQTAAQTLKDSWGNVDLTVTSAGRPFGPDVVGRLADDPRVARRIAGISGGLDLVGSVGALDRSLGAPTVQLSGVDQATGDAVGPFQLSDGSQLAVARLSAGEAVLTQELAGRLQARLGDRITVRIGLPGATSSPLTLRLAGIASRGPGAAYGRISAIFLPLIELQRAAGIPKINIVRIRAPGRDAAEIQAAHDAAPAVRQALASLPGGANLDVREVKADDLAFIGRDSGTTYPLLIALSLFVVLAAVALVVNLFLALAEERRPRLAVLRALGLSRAGMIVMSLMEAGLYALAGSLLGAVLGLGYAAYEVMVKTWPLTSLVGISHLNAPRFGPTLASVVFAISCGILVSLITVALAGIRTSRMSISSAVKELPDPITPRQHWWRWAWLGFLALCGAFGLAMPAVQLRAIGGALLIVAAAGALRGRLLERARLTVAGAALTAWSLALPFGSGFFIATTISLAVLGLVMAVCGITLMVAANLRLLERLVAAGSVRLGATLRPPLAYLTRRPIRTALTTGTFALTLAAISFFSVLTHGSGPSYAKFANGWDLVVTSAGDPSIKLPASVQSRIAKQMVFVTTHYVGPFKMPGPNAAISDWNQGFFVVIALSDEQFDHPPVQLENLGVGFTTAAQVWRAVRDDPNLAIVSLQSGRETLFLGDPTNPVPFRVIGGTSSYILNPENYIWVIVSQRGLDRIQATGVGTTLLAQVNPGGDPAAVALDVRRAMSGDGVNAVTTRELLDRAQAYVRWFNSIFTDLLDVALVVGVLSLAILALRAVIDRRRAIGVLRAIGYQQPAVLGALMVEVLIATFLGIAAGLGVGLATSYAILVSQSNGQLRGFSLDPIILLVPVGLVIVAVVVASIGPALRAAHIPPAEALRIVD
jgi:putative ABC transport system permease protein